MPPLSNKLLKKCCKPQSQTKKKLQKKLLSQELKLAEILPVMDQIPDIKVRQKVLDYLAETLAPEANDKSKSALSKHLRGMGINQTRDSAAGKSIDRSSEDIAHFARRPFRKKPCSGCPALQNGLCKCAVKLYSSRT